MTNRANRTHAPETCTRYGVEYTRIARGSILTIKGQGRSEMSSNIEITRENVSREATRLAERAGYNYISISDSAWVAQDGSCQRLTRSSYRRNPAGEWVHLIGSKITALEA